MNDISRYFSSYPADIKPVIEELLLNTEVKELLERIKGQVDRIAIAYSEENPTASWDWKQNVIKINPSYIHDRTRLIPTLLFELFNAAQTVDFRLIIENASTIDELIENIEKLEYDSTVKTNLLASKILENCETFLFKNIAKDFSLHYALQQVSGHSEKTAEILSPDKPYRGTLHHPLNTLTPEDREMLKGLIYTHSQSPEAFAQLYQLLKTDTQTPPHLTRVRDCARKLFN